MLTITGFAQQTAGRLVLAGGLAVAALVSPIAWSFANDTQTALPATIVASHNNSGVDQLQWIYDVQPHAQAPHVDTTVHQSR
ncbi:hypothetical protein FZI85_22730 [Mycobacterium sp. CBMA293]|uniref:hypothetical protein n=1 Tax=unclassified Mycolicibacterium TaxID=2636767 RepID=UPI0012DE649B|nr:MULTISPECIES: hypothetical protein [unclassified Mycolicibacterium]MUL45923.1 hypothetical protein [Mycolicibacterium sp. CBMA 360]MUL60595.1 hypothetical protein [Mycolicibacterium sp. CBMA 335]MUL72410.1 hypothetical protein [Mycolicibacterium sp. CBMA 311]MUL95189.1 hypothetical protein [Mycolicibacterium sp. CBMA 230]MUM06991.1 hypothetical protein [Mycolicibacterium sp. CBMA 213]